MTERRVLDSLGGGQPYAGARMPATYRHWLALAAILVCTFLVSLWELRAGHSWGDDFAQYIMQARNIVDGVPRHPTGYVYNPEVPHIGPAEYPPMTALILAVPYRLAGLDLRAMKIALLGAFLLSLVPIYWLIERYLVSPLASAITVLCFSLNPLVVSLHSSIGSDLVFLLFTSGFLLAAHHSCDPDSGSPRNLLLAVLCGALAYAAYATRSVGIVLFLVVPVADLLLHRRFDRFTCTTVLTGIGLVTLHSVLYASPQHEAKILHLFSFSPVHIVEAIRGYLSNGRAFLPIDWKPLSLFAYAVLLALALLGTFRWAQTRSLVLGVFAAGYFAVVVLYEANPLRYIIPLLPLVALAIAGGGAFLVSRFPRSRVWLLVGVAAYGTACVVALAGADRSPLEEGLGDKRFVEIAQYIERHSSPNALIVFRKPRLMAMLTGRRSCAASPAAIPEFLRSWHPDFVLIADQIQDEGIATQAAIKSYLASGNSGYLEVLSNGPYHLFARAAQ